MMMQPPRIEIERAAVQDLPALVPLFDAYRAFFAGNEDTARSESFLAERLRAGDSAIFFARTESGVDGFIQLYPLWSSWYCRRIWFLSDLYVRQSSRRLGLGRRLVERAVVFARETDASSVMLELPRSEPHLERFYAELGFEKDRVFELARKSILCEDRLSR
jgi:GNAT superfamily N-acetyltransferase